MSSDVYIAQLLEMATERKERTELRNRRLREARLREVEQVDAVWSVDTVVTLSDRPRRGRARTIVVTHGNLSGVTGRCTKCRREFPAIGLVAVDQRVPIRGADPLWVPALDTDPFSGHWETAMRHIIGWFCAGCKPRQFGKPNAEPTTGWAMCPTDGSSIDPPDESQVGKLLKPLGQAGDGPRRTVKHRNRKPKPMKPLG